MTLIFFLGGGGEEVRWKTVRTYGKILATPLDLSALVSKPLVERTLRLTICEKNRAKTKSEQCRFCTKTFSRVEHYRRHLRTQNNQASPSYPCPVCPKQDLQAQRPPTTPPTELPCPTKGRESKGAIFNAIFPARGH